MPKRFPQQLYRLIPALYPHFVEILESVGISGAEFFVLSFVKDRGKEIEADVKALPVSELKSVLIKAQQYDSQSGAAGFIARLESRGFLHHARISHEAKRTHFPDAGGYRDVMVLTMEGRQKLNGVNARVEDLFDRATSGTWARALLRPLIVAFDAAAPHLIRRLEEMAIAKPKN